MPTFMRTMKKTNARLGFVLIIDVIGIIVVNMNPKWITSVE